MAAAGGWGRYIMDTREKVEGGLEKEKQWLRLGRSTSERKMLENILSQQPGFSPTLSLTPARLESPHLGQEQQRATVNRAGSFYRTDREKSGL